MRIKKLIYSPILTALLALLCADICCLVPASLDLEEFSCASMESEFETVETDDHLVAAHPRFLPLVTPVQDKSGLDITSRILIAEIDKPPAPRA